MLFVIKFFPEITIKSKSVRKRFIRRLYYNLQRMCNAIHHDYQLQWGWDRLLLTLGSEAIARQDDFREVLATTAGICHFSDVVTYPLGDLADIAAKTSALWAQLLAEKTFAVRCKRAGKHSFTSIEVERYIGQVLLDNSAASGVDLTRPDVTVNVEINDDAVYIVNQRYAGIGGFPLGEMDPVLSLLSGGFDSSVASYLCMRRGMATHFCFFNMGGREHERGVKAIASYLWMKYGSAVRVRFVMVPFEPVVNHIVKTIHHAYRGVLLKRMMLRAAAAVGESLGIQVLVTGECVAQVSSQTLANLSVIDAVSDRLVLRPLIASDKGTIIDLARSIGVEAMAASIPEYCAVISHKPTIRANPARVEQEEAAFDFDLLEQAIAAAQTLPINDLAKNSTTPDTLVEIVDQRLPNSVLLDIRHPDERERRPFPLRSEDYHCIPFYELQTQFAQLDASKQYLLYCDKGVMSRLQAAHLIEQGYTNVKVFVMSS